MAAVVPVLGLAAVVVVAAIATSASGQSMEDVIRESKQRRQQGELCVGGNECCSPTNKCGLGEGDCDDKDDCLAGLVCGTEKDNCATYLGQLSDVYSYTQLAEAFSPSDDCCRVPSWQLQAYIDAQAKIELEEGLAREAREGEERAARSEEYSRQRAYNG